MLAKKKKKKGEKKTSVRECQRHADMFEAFNSPQGSAETGDWRCYDTDLKGQPPLPTTICNLEPLESFETDSRNIVPTFRKMSAIALRSKTKDSLLAN